MSQNKSIKLILVGKCGVGKSSIVKQIASKEFTEKTQSTISIDYECIDYKYKDTIYKLSIWDTAGQERYRSLNRTFYRNADIVLFIYDRTNKESFHELKIIMKEIEQNCNNDQIIKIIVENKCDLQESIDKQEMYSFFEQYNYLPFIKVSAKHYDSIEYLFDNSVYLYLKQRFTEDINLANSIKKFNENERNQLQRNNNYLHKKNELIEFRKSVIDDFKLKQLSKSKKCCR